MLEFNPFDIHEREQTKPCKIGKNERAAYIRLEEIEWQLPRK